MNCRNLGKFDIYVSEFNKNPDKIAEVFSYLKFVAIDCKFEIWEDKLKYVGVSPYFREVGLGEMTPQYRIIITENEKKEIENVKVEELP